MASLERPGWAVTLALFVTGAYALTLTMTLATWVVGHDPLDVPRGVWFPGCIALALPVAAFTLPSRGRQASYEKTYFEYAPRWFRWLVGLHVLYAVALTVSLAWTTFGSPVFVLQALCGGFLAVCMLGTWYGTAARLRD